MEEFKSLKAINCECANWSISEVRYAELLEKFKSEVRANERTKVLTQFLFELGKNVAYEKEKVFGTDVVKVDALMAICYEVAEQLEVQNNE